MKKLLTFFCVAALLLPVLLTGCGSGGATTVRLNEVTHSVFYAPQYVAMSLGFFADEGLDVELITQELNLRVRGPVDQIAKLTADDVMVVVDFTNAEIGTATFPVRAVLTDGFRDVGVLKSESVSASVVAAGSLAELTEEATETVQAVG